MDQLIKSVMRAPDSPTKLEGLSPQKFGKGAYAALSYTPSKLADNVLYKEITTMKKVQEESSKARTSSAYNTLLQEKLKTLLEEKEGVEQSLGQQINLYKKILAEKDQKHEEMINKLQKNFSQQIQNIIIAKQEEAKYAQSQKQLLESKIQQLQQQLNDLNERHNNGSANFDNLTRQHQKLQIHYKNACQKLAQTQRRLKQSNEKAKQQYEQLSRKLFNTEVQNKAQIERQLLEHQKQKDNLDKLHRKQLQNVQNKRLHQASIKNQQVKDLTNAFQSEALRLKDIIQHKQRQLQTSNRLLADEKQKVVELTKKFTAEITSSIHENNGLKAQIQALNLDLQRISQQKKIIQAQNARTISQLQGTVRHLKQQLQLNQVNYIREKDKNGFIVDDLHRQLITLRCDNQRIGSLSAQNNHLCKQIRNLKDLLLQSSIQMQRCKQQFLRIGREKQHLALKVRQLGYENQSLHRMTVQKDEQARSWKQSYYLSRR